MEIGLKARGDLKHLMDRSGKCTSDIKRAAHNFQITDTTFLQMQELVAFTTEAAAILNALKAQPEEKSTQLDLVPTTTNGSEMEVHD